LGGSLYPDAEEEQRFQELCERGIIISGITGVKWAVIHPATAFGYDMLEPAANIALNRKINDSLVEIAVKNGLGIAFENMRDRDFFRRYASSPDELVALVNDYQSERVGVCWDFGHANRNMTDQRRALRLIGAKLKATHVNDNHGQAMDEHLPPYMGNICWEDIMATLKEINYGGDMIYELSMTANMPMALRISAGRFVKGIGDYLLNL
jgi:sugar phosphate isomerase/epimerase